MNIGIVTFHNAHNYGAILQSVALKNILIEMGNDAQIIDYHNKKIDNYYKTKWRRIISGIRHNPLLIRNIPSNTFFCIAQSIRYNVFRNSINKYCDPAPINKFMPEMLVFGSDQIWNELITGNDLFYYGDYEEFAGIKKISYAASLGFGSEQFIINNRKLLAEFNAIGVREQSLQSHLTDVGLVGELNADPTLLLSSDKWDKIFKLKEEPSGQYIFVYAIRDRKRVIGLAKRLAKQYNLKIVELYSFETFRASSRFNKKSYSSVRDFVKYIKNAHAVVTDSFHGTAFSIIYQKPFVSVKLGNKGDDRIDSILSILNLKSRFIEPKEESIEFSIDNFEKTGDRLNELRQLSISYLNRSMG